MKVTKAFFIQGASLILALNFLTPSLANATTANGHAEITLSTETLATLKGPFQTPGQNSDGHRYMYIDTFYDGSVDSASLPLDEYPSGGTATTQTQPFILPVNDGSLPTVNTTYDSVTNPSGAIGLGGTFRVRSDFTSPTGSVLWGNLSLNQVGGNWWLTDNLNGGTFFELKPSTLVIGETNGNLSLSADLIFGSTSGWGNFLQLSPVELSNTVVGHINLVPAAVPVPGTLWLLGSALFGMMGLKRKYS